MSYLEKEKEQEKSYTRVDWQGGYKSQSQEFSYWIDDIEGKIPQELHGTLFRNGPGLLDINGESVQHPFDGDGMISQISFINGKAHFRNRFVYTEGYVAEKKAGKFLYRGVFGTQKSGGWLANAFNVKIKNIANTNVIYWGGKLLALWEAADPYRLDPKNLETLGKEHFNGKLSSGEAFSAHPRLDPSCVKDGGKPCLVNFAIKPNGLSTTITIFELNTNGEIVLKHAHSIPGFAFIHDFAITENYCIFFQNPVSFNPIPFALGLKGAGQCVKFQQGKPTRILVIPRNPENREIKVFETTAGFIFHHSNAYEEGGSIVVDSICYESLPEIEPGSDFREVDFEALKPGQLWRFNINLESKKVEKRQIEDRCCEFPRVHPDNVGRPYRYLYMGVTHAATGNAPLQAFEKLDVETGEKQIWSAAPKGFASEPVFVPRPGSKNEDDGWLLALVYDAAYERSYIVILDGKNLNLGPIAKLHLKHHIPYGLHGNFTPEVFI
jgi:all-trans-8'-apo-beta-carotenal 15,15'-oxygenase